MRIRVQDKEYYELIRDIINAPSVQSLKKIQHHFFQSRFDHVVTVSYYSYRIGKLLHLDYKAMARAGLLHDLFFYDWKRTHLTFTQHAYIHPRIAIKNAERITTLTPLEKEIILHHMSGATMDMCKSKEALIVNLVDDYSAVSEFTRGRYYTIFSKHVPYLLSKALIQFK